MQYPKKSRIKMTVRKLLARTGRDIRGGKIRYRIVTHPLKMRR
jgi:hypothetical protein